ncbi:MAG: LolA-related protein [Thiohalomonadales bacterium]
MKSGENKILLKKIQYFFTVFIKYFNYKIITGVLFFIIPTISQAANITLNELSVLMSSNNVAEEIHFIENKNLRFLNKPLILKGRFYFRSSNFLQKNIDKPFVKVYTLKYNTITFTDKSLESKILTLKDHPLIYASMKAFYTTMSGNFNTLKVSYKIELSGTNNQWNLILTPKSKRVLKYIKNVRLSGNYTFIERVVTNEANGDSSTIWMIK